MLNMLRGALPAATLSFACCALVAWAEPSPENLLAEMAASSRQLNYHGVMIYSRGEHVESLKIYHANENGVERERLVHLSGDQRELMRHGKDLQCVHMKARNRHRVSSAPGFPAGPHQRFLESGNISGPYAISPLTSVRVANRDAYEIALAPRDAYRYGHTVALDQETGLMLRSLVVDLNGQVLERLEYADIAIGGEIDAAVFADFEGAEHHRPEYKAIQKTAQQQLHLRWRPGWLPDGFRLVSAADDSPVISGSGLYTDGLAAFSVFVEAGAEKAHAMTMRHGASIAHSRARRDPQRHYTVTVVGEVPIATAKRVAQAVEILTD